MGSHTRLLCGDDAASFLTFVHGGGDSGVWTGMKTNPKLRLGLLTRLPLRASATGASNPSSAAVGVNGGSGRRGGRTWSFDWGLTPDSISKSMHSELQTRPQRRGKGGGGAKASHLRWGGGFGISPKFPKNWRITSGFHDFIFLYFFSKEGGVHTYRG